MDAQLIDKMTRAITLDELQDYMRIMVEKRGFKNESPRDIMLLMLEEVGELAKAIRRQSGLKIDTKKLENYESIDHELADVLIYVIVMANACDVDLFQALYEKEVKNSKRTWEQVSNKS